MYGNRRAFLELIAASAPMHLNFCDNSPNIDDSAHKSDANVQTSPDWDLLTDLGKGSHRIRRLICDLRRVSIQAEELVSRDLSYATTDHLVLEAFEGLGVHRPVREALNCTPQIIGGFGGGANVGRVVFETKRGQIKVRITAVGFVLNSEGNNIQNMFYSAYLSQLINMVFMARTGRVLSEPLLDALSGLARIRDERRACEQCTILSNNGNQNH